MSLARAWELGLLNMLLRLPHRRGSRSGLKDAFRVAEFAEYWQNLSTRIFYSRAECVSVCPTGKS